MGALRALVHLAAPPSPMAHQGGATQTCTTPPSNPRWPASTLALSAHCRGVASPPPSPQGAWATTPPQALATAPPAQVCAVRPRSCLKQPCHHQFSLFKHQSKVCSVLWLCFPCVRAWIEIVIISTLHTCNFRVSNSVSANYVLCFTTTYGNGKIHFWLHLYC